MLLYISGPGHSQKFHELFRTPGPGHSRQRSKGGRTEFVIRLIHAAGRSRFLLHEKATLLDLKVKDNINTGVQGHLQRLTYDAHGVNTILASDSAPLSSVGLGHGAVVWLVNKISACPQIATADSSHRNVKSLNSQDQEDFPTLQQSFPDSIAAALIDAP